MIAGSFRLNLILPEASGLVMRPRWRTFDDPRTFAVFMATLLVAATPLVLAGGDACDRHPAGVHFHKGQGTGHESHDHDTTGCDHVIPDTVVGAGETETYTGYQRAIGTVIVQAGGTVNILDAQIDFENTSQGLVIESGGTLIIERAVLAASVTSPSSYQIDVQPTSGLVLTQTRIVGGSGVSLATSNATVTGNSLEGIDVALRLVGSSATIENNRFIGNIISVNLTGGEPTLQDNSFDGGEFCVRDWLTHPTIVNNTFRGCHVGILHEQSHSLIAGNSMLDEAFPPGVGLWVLNTRSPIVEGNTFGNYGTGIRIQNARAFIRNNTIHDNVGHGIDIVTNSAPMDIQGNIIRDNGGDGIRFQNVHETPIRGNLIERNGGDGIHIAASPLALIEENVVRNNGGSGIVVDAASPGARLHGNVVTASGGDGMVIRGSNATITGGASETNAGHGLRLDRVSRVTVRDIATRGNALDGVIIGGSTASLTNVNASANARNGFTYDPMGPLNILGATQLTRVRAISNGAAGLENRAGNLTTATDAWWQGNGLAGVRNLDVGAVIDSRNAYWGSATGPRHALNPTGSGDRVEGNVLYVPFRQTPP